MHDHEWDTPLVQAADSVRSLLAGAEWLPNEATVMRYRGTSLGISGHRDARRFVKVVAVLAVTGAARFEVLADRDGDSVLDSWEVRPGDLVLLRGPGLAGCPDREPRPFHRVSFPEVGRISLTFRMDAEHGAHQGVPQRDIAL